MIDYYKGKRTYVGQTKNSNKQTLEHGLGYYSVEHEGKCAAEFTDNSTTGLGIKKWSHGEKFVGEFLNNSKNNIGIHTWPSGAVYIGEFKKNQPDGFGVLFTVHDGIKFVGRVVGHECWIKHPGYWLDKDNNPIDPKEAGIWYPGGIPGSRYEGEVDDRGRPHGKGKIIDRVGQTTEGEFFHGKAQGKIIDTYKKGPGARTEVVREYKNVMPESKAEVKKYLYGDIFEDYIGELHTGRYHGPGKLVYPNGITLEGNFDMGGYREELETYTSMAENYGDFRCVERRMQRSYNVFYDNLISELISKNVKVETFLELGFNTGKHLLVWSEIFPYAKILGTELLYPEMIEDDLTGDSFAAQLEEVKQSKQLLDALPSAMKRRQHWYYDADSYSRDTVEIIKQEHGTVDFIINDARHGPNVWQNLNVWKKVLSPNGLIITEEIGCFVPNEDRSNSQLIDQEEIKKAIKDGWRIYNFNAYSKLPQKNSLIGIWTESDLQLAKLKSHEITIN
jgi:hypothetical protein